MKIDGNKVLLRIAELMLNKKEAAKKAGIEVDTLNRTIKTGRCRTETAGKIAAALDVSVKEIAIEED